MPQAFKIDHFLHAAEDRIGRLEQEIPHLRVAAFQNTAVVIDCSGLKSWWRQPEVGANGFGSLDAIRVISRCHKGDRGDQSDPWNAH